MVRVEVTYLIITQRVKVCSNLNKIQLKNRTFVGYDNVIVIVLVLVWLTFVSIYSIFKV